MLYGYILHPNGRTEKVPFAEYINWWTKDKALGDKDQWRGPETLMSDGTNISTVFLGFDHGFMDGPPMLFETMVFGGELDGEVERYATKAQAKRGHEKMVQRVKEQL